MGRHSFTFEHGDKLTSMGATWFVSRAYNIYIDSNHTNWRNVPTYESGSSNFRNCVKLHRYFLDRVLEMKNDNLNKNKIDLTGSEVKKMALEIIMKMK